MKNNGDSAAKYEADDLEEQQLPGTPPPTVDSSPASVRGKMISSVMKTMKSPDSGDLTQLTRQITFKKKLQTQLELERLNVEVQKLKDDAAIDDLAKFHKKGKSWAGPAALAKAAKNFLQSSTNASWMPTLIATTGRPWPGMPMLCVVGLGVAAVCIEELYLGDSRRFPKVPCADDESKTCQPISLSIPSSTVVVIGSALFFLMVFRTNASYDRWWEGRKKWGMIINRTRDFSRQVSGFVKNPAMNDVMIRWTIAFAHCTKRHLRFERDLVELNHILKQEEIDKIQAAAHMPLYTLERLTEYCVAVREDPKETRVTDIIQASMDANITDFEDELGACERILKTPFPFAYVVHLRTFMVLWLLALPYALVSTCGWATIPTICVVAYALMGIETIGVEIENPFGHDFNDLPLDAICKTIESNLLEILARDTARKASIRHQEIAHKEACAKLFAEFDRDGNGYVSADDLEKALNKVGLPISKKQAMSLLRLYDPDGSGMIEPAEFEELYMDRVNFQFGTAMA